MKKVYIQPEFDLLKLASSEDILQSPLTGTVGNDKDWSELPEDSGTDEWL